jgi:hypothetical protein
MSGSTPQGRLRTVWLPAVAAANSQRTHSWHFWLARHRRQRSAARSGGIGGTAVAAMLGRAKMINIAVSLVLQGATPMAQRCCRRTATLINSVSSNTDVTAMLILP